MCKRYCNHIYLARSLASPEFSHTYHGGKAMDEGESMIGLAEAAMALRVAYQDCHRLMLLGKLRGVKRGGRWLVREVDVARLVQERGGSVPEDGGLP